MTQPPVQDRPAVWLYPLRLLYLLASLLFILLLVLQVFFAGLGVLVSPSYFAWHLQLGHLLSLPLFALFVLAISSRSGWRAALLPVLLFVLYGLQYAFVEGTSGPVRALHAVNALLMFWLASQQLASLAWRKVQAARPARSGAARPDSLGRSLAGGVLVLVGAALLFGAFFDDGPGFGNVALREMAEVSSRAAPNLAPEPQDAVVAEAASPDAAARFAETCASCHGAAGEGGIGPSLAANDDLSDTAAVVNQVLRGGGGMPGFESLSDEEVAVLTTYVRTTWGNDFGSVSVADVAAQR